MASSSQWSASRQASATASCWRCVGVGSGWAATCLRATSRAKSQLIGPSWGANSAAICDCICENSVDRSGISPPAPNPPASPPGPNSASNGVPRKGFSAGSRPSSGSSEPGPTASFMRPTVLVLR